MYRQFNIQQFYVLPTQCIYVFCVDLRTNSDYFLIQHRLSGFLCVLTILWFFGNVYFVLFVLCFVLFVLCFVLFVLCFVLFLLCFVLFVLCFVLFGLCF